MTKAAMQSEFTKLVAEQKQVQERLQQITTRVVFLQGAAAALADTELMAEATAPPATLVAEPTAEAAKD